MKKFLEYLLQNNVKDIIYKKQAYWSMESTPNGWLFFMEEAFLHLGFKLSSLDAYFSLFIVFMMSQKHIKS